MVITAGDMLIYVGSYFGLCISFYFLLIFAQSIKTLKDEPIKKWLSASIIVPAYNEENTLVKTIESLLKLDYPKNKYEIIIVNDGSTDNTLQIAQRFEKKHANITVLNQVNSGKGKALNNAIKIAKGEIVGALDADSYVDKDALKCIVAKFTDKSIVAVTPAMRTTNPTSIIGCVQEIEYIFGIYLRKVFSMMNAIHVTPGPFSFFRKSFFTKYGGYEEKNLTEDIEIALRIQSKGYNIENSSNAFVYTNAPQTISALYKQRLRWYKGFFDNLKNYTHLFDKKYGNLSRIVLPSALVSIALSIIMLGYTITQFATDLVSTIKSVNLLGIHFFQLESLVIDFFNFFGKTTIIGLSTLIVSIMVIIIANKLARKTTRFIPKIIAFGAIYWVLFGAWWSVALVYSITGKKIKWGKKYL